VKCETYRSQSTEIMRLTSSKGRFTAVNTISIVTNPALGIAAAPTLARVAVILKQINVTTIFVPAIGGCKALSAQLTVMLEQLQL